MQPSNVVIAAQGSDVLQSTSGAFPTYTCNYGFTTRFISYTGPGPSFTTVWEMVESTGTSYISGSGYKKFPDGIIMQWAAASCSYPTANAYVNTPITFPIAFPHGQLCIVFGLAGGNVSNAFVNNFIESRSATGATWIYSNGSGATSPVLTYFAIGY